MAVIRHWIGRMRGYPVVVIEGRDAEARAQEHRDAGFTVTGPWVPGADLRGAVDALTTIRDAMRGWTEGGVADLGPDEVFKVADDALDRVRGR